MLANPFKFHSPYRVKIHVGPIVHISLGSLKNDDVSKMYDPGIVSDGFDLAESKYVGENTLRPLNTLPQEF